MRYSLPRPRYRWVGSAPGEERSVMSGTESRRGGRRRRGGGDDRRLGRGVRAGARRRARHRPRRGHRRRRRELARGGHRAHPGRDGHRRRPRALDRRVLPRAVRPLRDRQRLSRARVSDPRVRRGRRAGGARPGSSCSVPRAWTRAGSTRGRRACCSRCWTRLGSAAPRTARTTGRSPRRATWRRRSSRCARPARSCASARRWSASTSQDGRVRGVVTADGVIQAEHVILAGGVAQPALSALAGGRPVPVGGARHQVAVTSPHPALSSGPLPMAFDLGPGLYFRQHEDGLLFGMSNPDEQPGEARAIDWDMLTRVRARLAELVPVTAELELRRIWAATIDYTPGPPADPRAAARRGGRARRGRDARVGGRPRDDVGAGGRALRGGPRGDRRDDRHRRLVPRRGPLRRARAQQDRDRPDRAAVPAATVMAAAGRHGVISRRTSARAACRRSRSRCASGGSCRRCGRASARW